MSRVGDDGRRKAEIVFRRVSANGVYSPVEVVSLSGNPGESRQVQVQELYDRLSQAE